MVPLVFQVAPGQPFGCVPVAITYEPLDGISHEALAPAACVNDRRRKRCEHFRLVLGKQLHHRLSTLGAADQEFVAHGFDASPTAWARCKSATASIRRPPPPR